MPEVIRSYSREVLSKLEKLAYEKKCAGQVKHGSFLYPIYAVKAEKKDRRKKHDVLISGGVHGDEASGVYAVLDFLELYAEDYLDRFNFIAYPCINPYGFEMNNRENAEGIDINRAFEDPSDSDEAVFLQNSLIEIGRKYLFTMDFHECYNEDSDDIEEGDNVPYEFFLWETCRNKKLRIGHKIVEEMEKDTPICRWDKIIGDKANGGVISYPEGMGSELFDNSFEAFLNREYTKQSFTIEVSLGWPMEKRVDCHIRALKVALEERLKKS